MATTTDGTKVAGKLYLAVIVLCVTVIGALEYGGIRERRGWERAMRARGCGVVSWSYTTWPLLGEVEDRAERGWICPPWSNHTNVEYFR